MLGWLPRAFTLLVFGDGSWKILLRNTGLPLL